MNEGKNIKLTTGKTIVTIIVAIAILVVSQMISMLLGSAIVLFGAPMTIGNIISGAVYVACAICFVKLFWTKVIKLSMEECKTPKFSLNPIWCIVAVVMPCMVSGILLLTPGHWANESLESATIWNFTTSAIFFYGIGTGIVEELIFRGVIMSALEYRWNKTVAVVAPSVLFGLLHIMGRDLDFFSIIQLLIAGSIVGILFSLVTYESGNIWNSALLHAVWNMIIIGGILHIGDTVDEYSIYNYVLDSESFLITGGDFGIEASVFAIAAYLIFIVLAAVRIKKQK